ncbi:MAG TPA: ABC transporter permease [Pyrinomonadaceae bacterium]|jgi:putative ABC transport system permease protein|nr:ABC transporter permease [Pyrinomonadaceae bacterium]
METLLQDIRYGIRMLLKSPSISIVATIALALGIGANTAIFSVVNGVLLRPLPFPDSDSLMAVYETDQQRGQIRGSYSYPNFFDLRDQNNVFARIACYHSSDFIMTGSGEPARLQGSVVTSDLLPLLGVSPMLGRGFGPGDDKPSERGRVVILSQDLFQRRFNSDPALLNQTITLDGTKYTVIGVMPRSFQFPIQNDPVELWTTIVGDASGSSPMTNQRGAHFLRLVARLKPGVTETQAQSELNTIATRLEQRYPDTNSHRGIFVESALVAIVGDIRPALLILLGAVACVLLIACANVANLLLARATSRYKEMAIRSALGANRFRIVRQLLTESVLLSLVGGGVGLGLAVWWSDLLVALGKEDIPRAVQIGLDRRVLLFTVGLSVLTGVVFGLVPAFQSSKTDLTDSLKEGGRGGGSGARRNLMRSTLVVSELAIAVILLVGAGLLIQSLWRLQRVDSGLQPHNVLTFNVSLPDVKYDGEKQGQFYKELKSRIQTLPGVQAASAVMPLPLSGDRFSISFKIDGRPVAKKDEPSGEVFIIDVDYFKTMGIPIINGRDFNDHDEHKSAQVIIVSEQFANQFFPGEDPIGKRIQPGITTYDNEKAVMREIVGVVGNVRNQGLNTESRAAYYLPETQIPLTQLAVVARTTGDPHSLISAMTKEVGAIDKDVPVFSVKTMDEYIASSVAAPRFSTTLLSIFAAVALVLTSVGLYGVMSYSVAQRTNEIGIRLALGAQTRDVLTLVVKQGTLLILVGLVIGLAGALALTRLVQSLLFGVTTKDPLTFVAAAIVLGLVGLFASYLPARRATKVDPIDALRCE